MAKEDYYEALGVNRDVDAVALKKAYPNDNDGEEEA